MFRNRQRRLIRPSRNFAQRQRKLPKSVSASRPFRIRQNRQLLSVPQHDFSLKVRRNFRLFLTPSAATTFTVSLQQVINSVREELGLTIPASVDGEQFALYRASLYCSDGRVLDMYLAPRDIEEAGDPILSKFSSAATLSGVIHVSCAYPVNNRPTWTRNTPTANLFTIGRTLREPFDPSATPILMYLDLDIGYTRSPAAEPSVLIPEEPALIRSTSLDSGIEKISIGTQVGLGCVPCFD